MSDKKKIMKMLETIQIFNQNGLFRKGEKEKALKNLRYAEKSNDFEKFFELMYECAKRKHGFKSRVTSDYNLIHDQN